MKKINYELIKEAISKFGYNRYVQNVVCDYFLIEVIGLGSKDLGVSSSTRTAMKNDAILYFNDMKCKDYVLNNVIPKLQRDKETFIIQSK